MKCFEKILGLYKNKRELTILQGIYLVIATLSLVVAGLMALINQSLGLGLLIVPLVSIVAFCMNTVAWAVVRLAFDSLTQADAADPKQLPTPSTSEAALKTPKKLQKSTKKS